MSKKSQYVCLSLERWLFCCRWDDQSTANTEGTGRKKGSQTWFAPIFLLYDAVHTNLLAVPKLLEMRNTNPKWFWISSPVSQNFISLRNFHIN